MLLVLLIVLVKIENIFCLCEAQFAAPSPWFAILSPVCSVCFSLFNFSFTTGSYFH